MAREFSRHQQQIIRRYYQNLDAIQAQKLAELVTEIYLASSPRRADALWKRVAGLLARSEDPDERGAIERILAERDVEGLAALAGQRF